MRRGGLRAENAVLHVVYRLQQPITVRQAPRHLPVTYAFALVAQPKRVATPT